MTEGGIYVLQNEPDAPSRELNNNIKRRSLCPAVVIINLMMVTLPKVVMDQ